MTPLEVISLEHEALLQFLYMAPVGLVQTSLSGEIIMLNPFSTNLLMPLQKEAMLSNLFSATETVAPELRTLVQAFSPPSGIICSGLRFQISAGIPGMVEPKFLEIILMKIDSERLMAVISDASLIVKREEQIRQGALVQ